MPQPVALTGVTGWPAGVVWRVAATGQPVRGLARFVRLHLCLHLLEKEKINSHRVEDGSVPRADIAGTGRDTCSCGRRGFANSRGGTVRHRGLRPEPAAEFHPVNFVVIFSSEFLVLVSTPFY